MKGIIVKGIAGFYYVKTENTVYECKARGIFKNKGTKPVVGDNVEIELLDNEKGIINEILPRKNEFVRPPIANVDKIIIVVAAQDPTPNTVIIDKFLVMAEKSGTEIAICINKVDADNSNIIEDIENIYKDIYPVILTSAKEKIGIEDLKNAVRDKKVAFAGPSGVGKSTLLNTLQSSVNAETGSISKKTKRGRHTTRHVEIFDMDFGGMIYDTPGFTSFDILDSTEEELENFYPDMEPYIGKCKYDNCRHLREPKCAVRNAFKEGKIKESRYKSYVLQMEDIRKKEKY